MPLFTRDFLSPYIITYLVKMRWLPSWLGKAYAQLFLRFGEEEFQLNDLEDIIQGGLQRWRVILSRLKSLGYLERVGRGRYKAVDPYLMVLKVAHSAWEHKIRQREYLPLISKVLASLLKTYGKQLISVVLYGSAARGTAKENSDVDILAVIENLPADFSERVQEMMKIVREAKDEKMRLWLERGIFANIQILPLLQREAVVHQPLYLDLLFDSVILFDRGLMEEVFEELKLRLKELNAKRVTPPSGRWYWELKPEAKMGEVLEL